MKISDIESQRQALEKIKPHEKWETPAFPTENSLLAVVETLARIDGILRQTVHKGALEASHRLKKLLLPSEFLVEEAVIKKEDLEQLFDEILTIAFFYQPNDPPAIYHELVNIYKELEADFNKRISTISTRTPEIEPQLPHQAMSEFIILFRKESLVGSHFFDFTDVGGERITTAEDVVGFIDKYINYSKLGNPEPQRRSEVLKKMFSQILFANLMYFENVKMSPTTKEYGAFTMGAAYSIGADPLYKLGDDTNESPIRFYELASRYPDELKSMFLAIAPIFDGVGQWQTFIQSIPAHKAGEKKSIEEMSTHVLSETHKTVFEPTIADGVISPVGAIELLRDKFGIDVSKEFQFPHLVQEAIYIKNLIFRGLPVDSGSNVIAPQYPMTDSDKKPEEEYLEIVNQLQNRYRARVMGPLTKAETDEMTFLCKTAARWAFVHDRAFLKEAQKDFNAKTTALSEFLNPVYLEGKNLGAVDTRKEYSPTAAKGMDTGLILPDQFPRAEIVLPRSALEIIGMNEFLELYNRYYDEDLDKTALKSIAYRKSEEKSRPREYYSDIVGKFSVNDVFVTDDDQKGYEAQASGNFKINFKEMTEQVVAVRIRDQKYRRFGYDMGDKRPHYILVERHNIRTPSGSLQVGKKEGINDDSPVVLVVNLRERLDLGTVDITEDGEQVYYPKTATRGMVGIEKYLFDSLKMREKVAKGKEEGPIINIEKLPTDKVKRKRGQFDKQLSLAWRKILTSAYGQAALFRGRSQASGVEAQKVAYPEEGPEVAQISGVFSDIFAQMHIPEADIFMTKDFFTRCGFTSMGDGAWKYFTEALFSSQPAAHIEFGQQDSAGKYPVVVNENGPERKTADAFRLMYREIWDKNNFGESSGLYFLCPMDYWAGRLERRKVDSKEETMIKEGLIVEEIFVDLYSFLGRYMYRKIPGASLGRAQLTEPVTITDLPPLTPDKLYFYAEAIKRYILSRFSQSRQKDAFPPRRSGQDLPNDVNTWDIEDVYTDRVIEEKIYAMYYRLGLIGTVESGIAAMRWARQAQIATTEQIPLKTVGSPLETKDKKEK